MAGAMPPFCCLPLAVVLLLVLILLLILVVLVLLLVLLVLVILVVLIVHDNLLFSARTDRAKPGAACAESDPGSRRLWERGRILAPCKGSMEHPFRFYAFRRKCCNLLRIVL